MKPFKIWNCSRKVRGIRQPKISSYSGALAAIRNCKCLNPAQSPGFFFWGGGGGVTLTAALTHVHDKYVQVNRFCPDILCSKIGFLKKKAIGVTSC